MRMSKTVGSSSVQGVEMWARKQCDMCYQYMIGRLPTIVRLIAISEPCSVSSIRNDRKTHIVIER